MMKTIKILAVTVLTISMASCNSQGIKNKALKTEIDSVSYALGLDIAGKLKGNFNEVDKDLFIQGVVSGIDSTDILIDKEKINVILRKFFQKRQEEAQKKQEEERMKKAEVEFADVKAAGIKFLEENKTKEGVQVTESGLQYIVIKEGTGRKPEFNSRVTVNYIGTTPDGVVFDSSEKRGKPTDFMVNRVIKGWTEGIQLMKEGAKYKFFIPQELAYGINAPQGGTGEIKPFMPLVFEVELVKVNDAK